MKKSNLIAGICYVAAGMLLLFAALWTDTKLSSLLFGFSGACLGPGALMIYKYCYWSAPQNRARYQEKLKEEAVEMRDERNVKLRDRSGAYAYSLGLVAISMSMVVFSVLGALGVLRDTKWIVLYLGAFLTFQVVTRMVIFRRLNQKI